MFPPNTSRIKLRDGGRIDSSEKSSICGKENIHRRFNRESQPHRETGLPGAKSSRVEILVREIASKISNCHEAISSRGSDRSVALPALCIRRDPDEVPGE